MPTIWEINMYFECRNFNTSKANKHRVSLLHDRLLSYFDHYNHSLTVFFRIISKLGDGEHSDIPLDPVMALLYKKLDSDNYEPPFHDMCFACLQNAIIETMIKGEDNSEHLYHLQNIYQNRVDKSMIEQITFQPLLNSVRNIRSQSNDRTINIVDAESIFVGARKKRIKSIKDRRLRESSRAIVEMYRNGY